MKKVIVLSLLLALFLTGCSDVHTAFGQSKNNILVKKVGSGSSSTYYLILKKDNEIMQFKTTNDIYSAVSDGSTIDIKYDRNFYVYEAVPSKFTDGSKE